MKPKRLRPHEWNAWRGYTLVCARCDVAKSDEAEWTSCISDGEAVERAAWRECAEAAARVMRR